jgi:hypothetical protein
MARGKASGHALTSANIPTIMGMARRGDRDHDIAAWFGVNQGRIAEAKDGKWGKFEPADPNTLPPRGPPGIKGRRLRAAVGRALDELAAANSVRAAAILQEARAKYDSNEA